MSKKTKISFVLPESLQEEFKQKVLDDGYDSKGKSRWVSESVEQLLKLKSYPDLVKLNDEMKGFNKLESVVVIKELKDQIDSAIVEIRKNFPSIEGVQSRIFRTAIVQRILLS